nr:NADH dehydrogenase subunit 3 [Frankliniella intonsa]WKD82116.1 NADH dehydrogenase subunit 3 [Frankliniella intonsa]WKD82142.1 NADH dehydrogenase subunit 3 [Frankliniella intonsa]WKD82454.1 NADH dehydrogenase subunit 3 [Frankliniella intonsa]WKD82480.1 NADH dehydrogenase subunit 3 [Frankliniella intonsa]
MVIFSLVLSSFMLSIVLILLMTMFSKKTKNWREKSTPFECGFNFFNPAKMPFSMRFFLIAILFIIFDVEIALILPFMISIFFTSLSTWISISYTLLMVILLGTIIEWKENSFEWKI